MLPIFVFIVTWSGFSIAFEIAHYGLHKKKLYVPCVYIYDENGIRYAVNAKFKQLGGSRNFRLEDYNYIENPNENCPEIELPVQLPVEEHAVQLPEDESEGEGEEAVQLPIDDGCPNENASEKAKANHPECD